MTISFVSHVKFIDCDIAAEAWHFDLINIAPSFSGEVLRARKGRRSVWFSGGFGSNGFPTPAIVYFGGQVGQGVPLVMQNTGISNIDFQQLLTYQTDGEFIFGPVSIDQRGTHNPDFCLIETYCVRD